MPRPLTTCPLTPLHTRHGAQSSYALLQRREGVYKHWGRAKLSVQGRYRPRYHTSRPKLRPRPRRTHPRTGPRGLRFPTAADAAVAPPKFCAVAAEKIQRDPSGSVCTNFGSTPLLAHVSGESGVHSHWPLYMSKGGTAPAAADLRSSASSADAIFTAWGSPKVLASSLVSALRRVERS